MAQILIIDDDSAIQKLLSRALTRSHHEVILASNGTEGIEKAIKLRPDLIICDWLMPGLDGIQVCRQVKMIPELSTTFFILLTALGSVEDRIIGLDAGADDFLCKPIEINELQARVRSGLRLHQLSHDLQQQKKLLEDELNEAADYVCSILPEPITNCHLKVDFRFLPSFQLGGDSLDFYWLDEDHLGLYLVDVAGHGLRAALPSLSVINLIRYQGLNSVDYYQPIQVLNALNKTFPMTERNDKYFTIWYGVYNQRTHHLTYASAGHPPAILLSYSPSNKLCQQQLTTSGLPIGMFDEARYIQSECKIEPGSILYLFSDGIYEIEQNNGQIWGLDKFIQFLETSHDNCQPHLDQLIQALKSLHKKTYFQDDLSIVQIQFLT
ncbi:response regulator receiver modulated serine phosphatase [Gloeothece citriformis PCC 7424]|uniref:Response regulator receiver modulated serine phosphatase n=1 Tax=Gloeothece citriformis (strain PCC 7424) TaxID=65393 RepID=B7KHT5_GLOC7|nr:SpoIIE family protein phosphatase [Gloeothece citriformis]ACK72032.1 response regulator receiver modulated serine phosphatase [Gloeothece citriformis PCC 7424]